jgi:hypothetical protein
MELSGIGLGLQQLVQGAWKRYVVPGMDGTALEVTALLKDRDNGLWVGTTNQGVYRVHDGKADHFRSVDGLSSDSVNTFLPGSGGRPVDNNLQRHRPFSRYSRGQLFDT